MNIITFLEDYKRGRYILKKRIALIGLIVRDLEFSNKINDIISIYSEYIIGRMGIPYREKGISIMSIVVDAPNDVINSLSGKLGMISGVSVKVLYA